MAVGNMLHYRMGRGTWSKDSVTLHDNQPERTNVLAPGRTSDNEHVKEQIGESALTATI